MKKLTTNNKVNSSKYINDNNKKYFLTALEWNDVVDNINDIIDAIETSVVPSLPSEQQTGSYGQLTNSILSIRSEMEGLNSRLITATLNILRIDNSLLNLTLADVVDGHAIITETDPTVKNWAKNDIYVNSLLLSDISRIEIGSGLTVNVNNSIATVSCVPQGITLAQLTSAIDSVQEDISARINSLLQQINTISGSGSLSGNELPTEPLYIYVEVSSAGWKTYITDNNVLFEPNTAYIVTSIDTSNNNTPVLTSITQAPAGTPLLLLGAGQKQLTVLTSTPAPITNNILSIGTGLPYQTGEYPYVLALLNGNISFTLWEGSASDLEGRVVLILNLDYSGNSQNENPSSGGGNEPSQGGDDTPTGGDTPASGGDDTPTGGGETPTGGDTPSGGDEPSTGGDDNQGGSGLSSQLQPDTTNGYWVQKSIDGLSQEVIDFLEYDVFDYDTQRIFFICPENSSLQDVSLNSTYSATRNGTTQLYSAADYILFNTTTGELTPVDHILSPSPDADANGHAVIPIRATLPGKQPKTLNIDPYKQHLLTFSWSSASGTITDDGGVITSNIPTLSCDGDLSKAELRYRITNASPANCVSLINNSGLPVADFIQNISSLTVPQPQIVVNSTGSATIIANFGPTNVYSIPQGERSFTLTTTKISYGHWEVKEGDGAWQTATELEYYGADASNYQVKFVPATGIENLTADYFGWDPSLAENERNNANRQDIGSDSASVTGLINYVTVNVSTGVVTLPDSTINNSSNSAEIMETITIGANVKVNDATQGDPILFDIKVKRKKVSFRFSSSTGYVSDSAIVVGGREIEMPDIQIQKGTGAEWINIEDDTSDYFKGNIRISRPVTDTTVIRLNNEVENSINTSYSVTIPYNDAKNPYFWSNLIEVISSGECVLSMSWGPYDQYTFASTQHVTVTSEYSEAAPAPTPPSNDDMY